jgi:hypothetical protein
MEKLKSQGKSWLRFRSEFATFLGCITMTLQVAMGQTDTGSISANQSFPNERKQGTPGNPDTSWFLDIAPAGSLEISGSGPSHCVIQTPNPMWVTDPDGDAAWIGPPATEGSGTTPVPAGTYIYDTQFLTRISQMNFTNQSGWI